MVAAQHLRCIHIGISTDLIKYQTVSQYIQPLNSVFSRVYAEAYQETEWSGGEFYVPLSGPLYQPREITLPMLTISRQPNRVILPADTQVAPLAAQKLLNSGGAGTAGTSGFAAIYSVELLPVSVGRCTVALGVMILDGGGAITSFITPFGYYDVSSAGQFGPSLSVQESFSTPRYVTTAYNSGDSTVWVYYYLFDGYGGMTVDLCVHWSLTNASQLGMTTITPPTEYGLFTSNSRIVF